MNKEIYLEEYPKHKNMRENVKRDKNRLHFHMMPPTGWMNDPNGFSYFNGKWHLFYQWYPFAGYHGMKHWYHVVSDDLVHWKNIGLGMKPTLNYDNYGCFSGSGFVKNEFLYLVYTGNHKDISTNIKEIQRLSLKMVHITF